MPSVVAKFHSCEGAIELFSRGGQPACELLASNPLAGFCLALTHIFKSATCAPLATANDLVQKPQREILAWCGFKPATEAIAKIGRKVAPESLTIERSLQLRRILVDGETREMLAHLKKINAGVIDLVSSIQLRKAITPQLLNAVADSDEELSDSETAPLLKDTLKMRSMLRRKDRLQPFASRRRIVEIHDELVLELNTRGNLRSSSKAFPPPPIMGWQRPGEQISAIRTIEELQAHGRKQRNCCRSYEDRLKRGTVWLYRVEVQGEVCTLSLIKNGAGGYKIGEFKAACNGTPSAMTQFVVRRWLNSDDYAGQLNLVGARRSMPHNRPLPSAPLSGGSSDKLQIEPVCDRATLRTLLGNQTAVEWYCDRARRSREHFYKAVTPQASHLVAIQRILGGFRIKEVRRVGGGSMDGESLNALGKWLGQGKFR